MFHDQDEVESEYSLLMITIIFLLHKYCFKTLSFFNVSAWPVEERSAFRSVSEVLPSSYVLFYYLR